MTRISENKSKKKISPKEFRKQREKQRRREDIILAAEGIIASRGFEKTNMDQVAERAGFSKTTIYQYFNTKEDLYLAICAKSFQTFNNLLQKMSEQLGPNFDLYSILNVIKEFIFDYPSYAELIDDMFSRKALAEIDKKQCRKQKLTISEQEFFEQQLTSHNFLLKAVNRSLEESKDEVDKKTRERIAEALSSISTGFINDLLHRYKYFGHTKEEIEELLRIVFRILEFGVENYSKIPFYEK